MTRDSQGQAEYSKRSASQGTADSDLADFNADLMPIRMLNRGLLDSVSGPPLVLLVSLVIATAFVVQSS